MRNTKLALAGLLALGTWGCSPGADVSTATKAIAAFHTQLNAGDFTTIYQTSASQMKSASSEADFVKLLSAVHRKLGGFVSGQSVGWNDNMATGGHFVTINYTAKYQHGDAGERFVYLLNGVQAALVGYNVNSNALIEN